MALPKLTRSVPGLGALLFGFSLHSKSLFFRQVATMVTAALPISKAVQTAGVGSKPKLAVEMSGLIDKGYAFSQVLARYPHYFSDYEVAVVKAGEGSGTLDRQLQMLATELENTYFQQKALMGKLAYPILVAHCAVFIPPLVLLVQKGPSAYFHLTLGILVPFYVIMFLLLLFYRAGAQSGSFRRAFDGFLAFVPILGGVVRLMATTRLMRVLSNLTESGFLPDKAIMVATESCGNAWIAGCVMGAWRAIGDTARTSQVMTRSRVFTPTTCAMVASGEESGQMGMLMAKAGEMMEAELQSRLNMLVTVFPALMMIGVGGMVGFIVIKIFGGYNDLLKSLMP
jgi:type II secretory pathway component PulF